MVARELLEQREPIEQFAAEHGALANAPKGAVEGDFTAATQPVSSVTFKPESLKESDRRAAEQSAGVSAHPIQTSTTGAPSR